MRSMNRVVTIAVIVLLLLVAGCYFSSRRPDGFDCSPWVKPFFWQPLKVREAEFVEYDVATQYDVYLCGNQVIHPPTMYADLFARKGEKAVGFLKTKLSQATDDPTIRDIILVFNQMHRQKTYAVAHDRELMDLMTASVGKIEDAFWRDFAEEKLDEVKKPSE